MKAEEQMEKEREDGQLEVRYHFVVNDVFESLFHQL